MYATALEHGQGGSVISHVNISERKQVEEEMIHLLEEIHRQRAQLRALTRRLGEVQENERKQLAGELHDQVGQKLTALDLNLNIIRARLVELDGDSLVQARLDDSLALVEQTATTIRDVMSTLRPPMLDDYGLAATLRWYGAQMAERGGFTLTVLDETASPHLPSTVENVLFRIAQEALTNVVKHAQASAVTIQLEQDNGAVRMIVADNGRGFERVKLSETHNWSRWGLMTMAERAEAAGGRCRVESHPNQGTQVIVEVRR
jgi:signal transduction histidine kinase